MENEVVLVEVFGTKDKKSCNGCNKGKMESSCSTCGSCGGCSSGSGDCSGKPMYEQYKDFEKYIKNTDIANNVEVEFIDVKEANLNRYEYIKKAMEKKYALPIIAINEYIRFYGGMKDSIIYNAIKKELNNNYM